MQDHEDKVEFSQLDVNTPNGKNLIKDLNLSLVKGSRLLIQGPSGIGKTTLLRTVAGLWSYSEGIVTRPQNSLFLSQSPIFHRGV